MPDRLISLDTLLRLGLRAAYDEAFDQTPITNDTSLPLAPPRLQKHHQLDPSPSPPQSPLKSKKQQHVDASTPSPQPPLKRKKQQHVDASTPSPQPPCKRKKQQHMGLVSSPSLTPPNPPLPPVAQKKQHQVDPVSFPPLTPPKQKEQPPVDPHDVPAAAILLVSDMLLKSTKKEAQWLTLSNHNRCEALAFTGRLRRR